MKASVLMLKAVVCAMSLVLLTACGQVSRATPTPTLTAAPTVSPTSTVTPIPTSTSTPESTPTSEVKQFPQCNADHWRDETCFVPLEALADGSYLEWLNANWNPDLPAPDPKKVIVWGHHPFFLEAANGVDLSLDERVYAIGFSYNWTKCGVTWGGVSHEMICTIIPVALSVPNSPGESAKWVFLREQAYNESDSAATAAFKKAEAAGKLIFGGFSKDEKTGLSIIDDGVDQIDFLEITAKNYPDIYDRMLKYQETFDPRWLSGKAIVMNVFL